MLQQYGTVPVVRYMVGLYHPPRMQPGTSGVEPTRTTHCALRDWSTSRRSSGSDLQILPSLPQAHLPADQSHSSHNAVAADGKKYLPYSKHSGRSCNARLIVDMHTAYGKQGN